MGQDDFSFTDLRQHWNAAKKLQTDYRLDRETPFLQAMFDAREALKKIGWNDAVYCPKDGSTFLVIEAGSTGVFECHYHGDWPTGSWWIHDSGDLWPARPILWKPLPTTELRARAVRRVERT